MKATARSLSIASVAALGGFLFGFDTAVINGAVTAVTARFDASPAEIGVTVSAALIGCAGGAYLAGSLADRFGRTRTMTVAALLFFVSAVLSGACVSLVDLSVWRFLGGVAVGVASVVVPAYIAEIAPARLRGRLGSMQQLAIVFGIFVALVTDYFLARAAGSASSELWFGVAAWRWMFVSEAVPAIAYGAGALLIPESPRWLGAPGGD
jgi:MFS transporter, SP family, sugar:H+ symporter